MRPHVRAMVALLRGYKTVVSPLLPRACRFHPTCSIYAIESLERHGAAKGLRLAIKRILRCHPLSAGGFDPVP